MPRNEGFGEDSGRRKATVGSLEQGTEKETPLSLRQERKSDKSDITKGITLGKSETSEGDEVTEMTFKQKSPTQCRAWNISARWVYPSSPSSPSIGFSCFWADADCMRSIALCWAPRMRAISSSGASVRASISTADSSDTRPA